MVSKNACGRESQFANKPDAASDGQSRYNLDQSNPDSRALRRVLYARRGIDLDAELDPSRHPKNTRRRPRSTSPHPVRKAVAKKRKRKPETVPKGKQILAYGAWGGDRAPHKTRPAKRRPNGGRDKNTARARQDKTDETDTHLRKRPKVVSTYEQIGEGKAGRGKSTNEREYGGGHEKPTEKEKEKEKDKNVDRRRDKASQGNAKYPLPLPHSYLCPHTWREAPHPKGGRSKRHGQVVGPRPRPHFSLLT
ncbi:hypothetical protein K438DRAFT_2049774 [Mycena galopus ATCC 62051]|nr:hypothetical protein K438DRAFT_2049774 [Mycena galopus ATCC 62051]